MHASKILDILNMTDPEMKLQSFILYPAMLF